MVAGLRRETGSCGCIEGLTLVTHGAWNAVLFLETETLHPTSLRDPEMRRQIGELKSLLCTVGPARVDLKGCSIRVAPPFAGSGSEGLPHLLAQALRVPVGAWDRDIRSSAPRDRAHGYAMALPLADRIR